MSEEVWEKAETTAATTTKSKAAAATSPEKRRSTVPDVLRPQPSFEKRYSAIINEQILETSINMEVLQRQMNAFFPFSRAASLADEGGTEARQQQLADTQTIAKRGTDVEQIAEINNVKLTKAAEAEEAEEAEKATIPMEACVPAMSSDLEEQNQRTIAKK